MWTPRPAERLLTFSGPFLLLTLVLYLSAGLATEIKPDVGKEEGKNYKSPEYYAYNDMSFYDIEKSVEGRVPQPKSGLTEYW